MWSGLVRNDGHHATPGKLRRSIEKVECQQEAQTHNLCPKALHELTCGSRGAASREHVVDDEDPAAARARIGVHLEPVGSVLERVLDARLHRRQLARLAYRDE